jgi:Flp pilus assembly protein TadG
MNLHGIYASRLMREDAGSTMVEFAIAVTTLLIAVLAIIGGSLALYADHYVANAASEGARYAMVRGSGWSVKCASPASYSCTADSASVKAYLLSIAPLGVSAAQTNVVTTWPATNAAGTACGLLNGVNSAGCSVTVVVSYNYNLSVPLLPKKLLLLTSSSTMPITQ